MPILESTARRGVVNHADGHFSLTFVCEQHIPADAVLYLRDDTHLFRCHCGAESTRIAYTKGPDYGLSHQGHEE